MFLDRVEYSGAQITSDTFSASVKSGAASASDGVNFVSVVSEDSDTSKYVACVGSISSGVFTIKEVFGSSAGGAIPSFSGQVSIYSTICSGILERKYKGRAGVLGIGQSNMVSWNTGNDARDFVYSNVLQWDTANGYTKPSVYLGCFI